MIRLGPATILMVLAFAAALAALAQAKATAGQPDTAPGFSEQAVLLSRLEPEATFFPVSLRISRDNAHVAYAAKNAQGMFAVMDHTRSDPHPALAKGTPLFSDGEFHWAFVAHEGETRARAFIDGRPEALFKGIDGFGFSPDGSRWAYRAGVKDKQAMVVNGSAGPSFDVVIKNGGPLFSPDSRRLAYGAMNGKQGYLVVDGESRAVDGLVTGIVFSPDSRRAAWVLKKGPKMQVFCDDAAGPIFDAVAQPAFSPDSQHLVYAGLSGKRQAVLLDGKEQGGGDAVGTPLFSPDGRHLAFTVSAGGRQRLVLDGKPGPEYEEIGVFLFSPDSSRLAYMVQRKGQGSIVVNEEPGPFYDSVGIPLFSPDGSQLAYYARKDKSWFMVQNGRAHAERYDQLSLPVFSADGRRLSYAGRRGDRMLVIVDEKPLGSYDAVSFAFFSPGGAHAAYTAQSDGQWRVYVDGQPGKESFTGFLREGQVHFAGETALSVVGLRLPGPEFWRLEITIGEGRSSAPPAGVPAAPAGQP